MIYNKEYETMPREDLEQLQVERLQTTLNRVYRNVAFYKSSFDENKINIEDIKSVDDITRLPFTTKEDLRNSYPYDMFAVPLRDIVRIQSSMGRTGVPIALGYTKNDISNWAKLVARLIGATGITENDFVQIAFDYSMVTGGFGYHYGAEKIGASVIPSSSNSNIKKQILIMRDYKSSVLMSTPSYAFDIADNLAEMGIHPEELNLKTGIFGAEPWSEKMRDQIEERLHINAYSHYGVNMILGPGTAGECEFKNGLHVNEDHFIVEIINPDTLEPVKNGEEGELVFTTITKEGYPLIRYRTGDLSRFINDECECGRTFKRIARVTSRTDDMIVIRGINFFPGQVEDVLKNEEGFEPNFRLIIGHDDGKDNLEIQIEVSQNIFFDEIRKLMELKERISKALKNEIGIVPKISLVESGSLNGKSGSQVVDNR